MTQFPLFNLARYSRSTTGSPGFPRRRGFTLVELVLSSTIMSILVVALASAILIASKALPSATTLAQSRTDTADALNQLAADLACATTITEFTATAITITVADRGHGTAGLETIRWAWSGTAGDPLTRSYNSSTPATIASNVTALSFTPVLGVGTLTSAPRVLMFIDPSGATSDDLARQAKLTAWQFPVTMISANSSQAQVNTAARTCDVVYIPEGIYTIPLLALDFNPPFGMVNENELGYGLIGVSTFATIVSENQLLIADNTHDITRGLASWTPIPLCSGSQSLHGTSGTIAPDAKSLAVTNSGNVPALVVVECNGMLSTGERAQGRRVILPWGGQFLFSSFDYNGLNANARTFLKRSLAWAAAPVVYSTVQINLTVGNANATTTQVELLNQPKVPRP